VASVSQKEIDAILKRNFGPKEAGFLSGCLRVEHLTAALPLMVSRGLSLSLSLSSPLATLSAANALVHMQSTEVRRSHLSGEDKSRANGVSGEALDSKVSDLFFCLSARRDSIIESIERRSKIVKN
jgi:hypothetical protein